MNTNDIQEFAANVPLFKELSKQDRGAICEAMIMREFSPNEVIVHEEDEETQTFFIIAAGTVHIAVLTSEGKQAIIATLQKGDFFGEMAILDGEPRSASVIAATPCTLLMLYRKPFLEILQKFPRITIEMLMAMSKRLRRANRHMNTLSLMSVYGRVAEVLLQLARDSGERHGDVVVVANRPTHQAIADMAGTSRETVSRVLSQLQKKHYISMDRNKMVILNEEKLYD
ncbi:MAG: cyclic nucleotide-binding domain-containing protein [Chitinivibrionales bacterium]|nr:cyclic nucleotide-binding domain-containing protein [Chitinivibrionales bacterium]MBD3395048.1 cyclic nucleotide-binding domain-containing protein [Chitinivibrionales bacterium]